MISINQKQLMLQKLSPQQIQFQKLLQLNSLALEQRIKTELELNPILEEDIDLIEDIEQPDDNSNDNDEIDDIADEEDYNSKDDEFEVEDFMNDDEYFEEHFSPKSSQPDETTTQPFVSSKESLQEHLLNQLYLLNLDERLIIVGEEIIGNIEDDGYLKQKLENIINEVKMFKHIDVSVQEAEEVLKKIQTFDPVGIGARDLQECLLVQIQNSSFDPYYSFLAEEIIKNHFDDLSQKRFDALMTKMNLSEETLKTVISIIKKLNPKPGEGSFQEDKFNQIIPDFIIEKIDDNYVITLNDRFLPSVTINKTYLEILNNNKNKKKIPEQQKNTYKFLKEKFESAKWFIESIEQRRDTLLLVMRTILEKQYEFFEKGPNYIKPLIYKDIANTTNLDISTISRVVNGKYVQCDYGIFELKYFFSEGLETDSGEEVSNRKIKERIKELIENENKKSPLSDETIVEILNKEGIHIARRTVAKYRGMMKIPIARLRKSL